MQEREVYCIKQRGEEQKGKRERQTERTGGIRFGHSETKQEVLVMEAVATATEREKARQAEIKKLQNETCFIGHPFGVGIVSFKYMMGSVTSYGFSAIFIYYLYAAAPQGLGLTQLEASQFITLDIALGSIFGEIGFAEIIVDEVIFRLLCEDLLCEFFGCGKFFLFYEFEDVFGAFRCEYGFCEKQQQSRDKRYERCDNCDLNRLHNKSSV